MQYYTITEVAEKLGIDRRIIMRLVKTGKIESIKGEERRSPYKISQTELKKIDEMGLLNQEETAKKIETKINSVPEHRYYEDFIEMQKVLVATMRDLASTQEQIALTLAQLVKKV